MPSAHQKFLFKVGQAQAIADQDRIAEAIATTERGTKVRDFSGGVVVKIDGNEEYCLNYGGAIQDGTVVLVSRSVAGAAVTGVMGTNS
jgi:hypothetical protein